jgi:protoporphyrin/coproporphyrin ferrochelatase
MTKMSAPSSAVLLLAHGTPDRLGEMAEYLAHVTAGRPMPAHVVEELQHRYAEIGLRDEPLPGGPPLTRWTLRQGELLSQSLGQKVYIGMRNWHPFIAGVVAQMKADGVTHARVLCLAPQNSRTSTGLYRRALEKALAETPGPAFTFDFIAGWAHEPLLAQAFAERLTPALASARAADPAAVMLFTAHSVPCRTIMAPAEPNPAAHPTHPEGLQHYGHATLPDPYPVECKETAMAIAKLSGLSDKEWFFAFQSQGVAGAPWIGPTVEDTLTALAAAGHKSVAIQPVGFLCDHVEILYDIDINFREFAAPLGIALFRAPSLNDSPTLIRAIAHVLEGAA